MPTRQYLTSQAPGSTPTAGEKSVANPVGALQDLAANSGLTAAKSATQISAGYTTTPVTTDQDAHLLRCSSIALAAQTIAAADWTIAVAAVEANTNANMFLMVSIYVYRTNSGVVGFIYDSHTALGTEFATAEQGRVVTVAGNAVTTLESDFLVIEVWTHCIQGMATGYSTSIYYNGTVDPVQATATTDAASYLEYSGTLTFAFPVSVPATAVRTTAAIPTKLQASPEVEFTLVTLTEPDTYQLLVDTSSLLTGELLYVRIYTKVLAVSTEQVVLFAAFEGSADPIKISAPIPSVHSIRFTLVQASGVPRNVPWQVLASGFTVNSGSQFLGSWA